MLRYICWCHEVAHRRLQYVGCPGIVLAVWIMSRKRSIWSSPYVWHQCVELTSRAGHYEFTADLFCWIVYTMSECFSLILNAVKSIIFLLKHLLSQLMSTGNYS